MAIFILSPSGYPARPGTDFYMATLDTVHKIKIKIKTKMKMEINQNAVTLITLLAEICCLVCRYSTSETRKQCYRRASTSPLGPGKHGTSDVTDI